jgi:hypothetical protein
VQHGAVLGRHVGGVDDVLDADRDAVQRADRLAAALALIRGARLRERVLLVEELPRLDGRLELAEALEAALNELFGTQQPFRDAARRLRGGERHRAYITLGSHSPICGKT